MKALLVYDSKFGNTEKVAQAIAAALGPGEEIQAAKVGEVSPPEAEGLDLLVVGSPVHTWGPTAAVKGFLKGLDPAQLSGLAVAAFDTVLRGPLTGSAARKIEKALADKGGRVVTPAEQFLVKSMRGPLIEGELERAKTWGRQLAEKLRTEG